MSAESQRLEDIRLAVCKVNEMLPVFIQQVRESEFDHAWKVTAIAALAEQARSVLTEALTDEENCDTYVQAGENVDSIFWGIGEQLQGVQGESRSDLCWGLLEGMEELLKKAGVIEPDMQPALDLGQRGTLARRAGCAISDLATALIKLMETDKTAENVKTAELTLVRRIEALSGVVISAADEDHTDMQDLEELLTDTP